MGLTYSWGFKKPLGKVQKHNALKSVHIKNPITRSLFLSKALSFSLTLFFHFSKNDNAFERNKDCETVFLKWTDFNEGRSCDFCWYCGSYMCMRTILLCLNHHFLLNWCSSPSMRRMIFKSNLNQIGKRCLKVPTVKLFSKLFFQRFFNFFWIFWCLFVSIFN